MGSGSLLLAAVMKMMGTVFERSVPRMSSASSKPSMVGMWMSSSASAKSCTNNNSSAAGPEVALWISRSSPESSASRASRFSSTSSTSRHFTLSTIFIPPDRSVHVQQLGECGGIDLDAFRHRLQRGRRHGDHLRGFKGLYRRDAAGARDGPQARGAVSVGPRKYDAQQPLAVSLGCRFEQHVDGGPRIVHALVYREGEGAVLLD